MTNSHTRALDPGRSDPARAIIEAEPECVKTVGADGSLLQMNPAGLRLIEADCFADVAGADVFELVHPDHRQAFRELHQAVLRGERRTLQFKLVGLKGTERWMETTAVPFTGEDGETLHLAITRDITARRQHEAALAEAREAAEAANQAKSVFLANMSHEIRTPLTAILGYVEQARSTDDPEVLAAALRTIEDNGRHLMAILSDVLDVSRLEFGDVEIQLAPTDVRRLARSAVELLRARAERAGLTMRLDLADDLPDAVDTDPVRVRQILLNLLGNAVSYTEQGGVVLSVTGTGRPDGRVGLSFAVSDTGIGMDAETLRAVFAPFRRADSSMNRRVGGTGLGLAISRRLAERLGGDLSATSTPGQGSCFTLEVTAQRTSAAPAATGRAPVQPTVDLTGRHVLIAEDNPVNARLIEWILSERGATVAHAADGLQVLDHLADPGQASVDAIVMDMQMPRLDGYEATRRLREAGHGVRVVALTAHAMAEDESRCLEAGCDVYLTKPIDAHALCAACAWGPARGRLR